MRLRCNNNPSSSQPVAIARLDDHEWIICQRGYANVVALPSSPAFNSTQTRDPHNTVHGLIYNLAPADEARLDLYEGHDLFRNSSPEPNPNPRTSAARPFLQGDWDYNKHYLPVTIQKWLRNPAEDGLQDDTTEITTLVYVDELRTEKGVINDEYIGRMNRGISEAVKLGLDGDWVEAVMRGDIPKDVELEDAEDVGRVEGYVEETDEQGWLVRDRAERELQKRGDGY